ncbi:MAG: Mrp/NBP35 family ATP-binding protein [Deltaproteobacteria bacterium]|nr:Mrp/NBP35 family ATP-binding protein [Deltaproteobacteria bacterium]
MSAQQCASTKAQQKQTEQDEALKDRLSKIKHKIIVMSGKGGVGKSSVAAYLAVSLAQHGYQVGLMDVDLHGPSIPRLLGITGLIGVGDSQKGIPMEFDKNLQVVSIDSLLADRDSAVIWRGPLKIGVIKQFISDIEWNPLDYLIIDSPPGTGDEPLTVAQTIPDAMAIIVTTPQEVSLADVRKSINFCKQVNMTVLGVVENMSGLICPHCGREIPLFSKGGGERTARETGLRFLGRLPLEPRLVDAGDSGITGFLKDPDLVFSKEFTKLVDMVEQVVHAFEAGQAPAPVQSSE